MQDQNFRGAARAKHATRWKRLGIHAAPNTPRLSTWTEEDGVPLVTEYWRTPRKAYEVRSVEQVLFCAPLVSPPPFDASPANAPRTYYVLNDDVYGDF